MGRRKVGAEALPGRGSARAVPKGSCLIGRKRKMGRIGVRRRCRRGWDRKWDRDRDWDLGPTFLERTKRAMERLWGGHVSCLVRAW